MNRRVMYCPKQYVSLRTFEPERTIMVAFFSATGNTRKAARKLAFALDADEYEIEPRIPYTEEDLDWRNERSRCYVEMHDPDARPLISKKFANVGEHDVVFIGFPVWWGTAPSIIKTFLEMHNFYKKRIILFATSGGGGMDRAAEDLKESAGKGEIAGGRVLTGDETEDELTAWAKSLL